MMHLKVFTARQNTVSANAARLDEHQMLAALNHEGKKQRYLDLSRKGDVDQQSAG